MSQVEPSGVCQEPPTALEYGTSGKAFVKNVRELAYNEGLGVRSLLGRQMGEGATDNKDGKLSASSAPSYLGWDKVWWLEKAWAFLSHKENTVASRCCLQVQGPARPGLPKVVGLSAFLSSFKLTKLREEDLNSSHHRLLKSPALNEGLEFSFIGPHSSWQRPLFCVPCCVCVPFHH